MIAAGRIGRREAPTQPGIARLRVAAVAFAAAAFAALAFPARAAAEEITCGDPSNPTVPATLSQQGLRTGGSGASGQPDVKVTGLCLVGAGEFVYGQFNIVNNGVLRFVEPTTGEVAKRAITLWSSAIIIENGGAMEAGTDTPDPARPGKFIPFGSYGGVLTIKLWGADQSNGDPRITQGQGALCKSGTPAQELTQPCGMPFDPVAKNDTKVTLPDGTTDWFYAYSGLYGDNKVSADGRKGFFGYKSIGLSWGGSLRLNGYKGTSGADLADSLATSSGTSWIRLSGDLEAGATSLKLERAATVVGTVGTPAWAVGDEIVITTTDYLPDHSEKVTITKIEGTLINFSPPLKYPHRGTRYSLAGVPGRLNIDPKTLADGVETRAAVGLLTRSIRIVSAGDTPGAEMPGGTYSFGGHTVFRQGFKLLQIQGVEFKDLGQGGRLGHYPVHFHMPRRVPDGTFVKDSSINESMTRWVVLHATSNALIARNVGWKSIGHGYYLETGTETDNKFHSNLGVWARPAVYSGVGANVATGFNPRQIPGILSANDQGAGDSITTQSDTKKPTIFWISNGWNDFIGNMAAGAGACGACYWLLPALNSDMQDIQHGRQKWDGYAAVQATIPGGSPLKSFYRNTCTTAMHGFQTVGDVASCLGFNAPLPAGQTPTDSTNLTPVRSIARDAGASDAAMYYPSISSARNATVCTNDTCSTYRPLTRKAECVNTDPKDCSVTVLDHFTTSFNWAEFGFSAVWLRSKWYLLDNSIITDVQNAGLTFVSGGDYTRSSAPSGYWALAAHSIFIGQTQPDRPAGKADYATSRGPFNNGSTGGATCAQNNAPCINVAEGMTMYRSPNFAVSQRLYNIYDGPNYQDSNAYLDINTDPCTEMAKCMYAGVVGIRLNKNLSATDAARGYLPHAAIGWKQPNGFYYPPAFHSDNLFFRNVDIRHYLLEPMLLPGTYRTDLPMVQDNFFPPVNAGIPPNIMTGFTDIDRQTELSDDDGSLTGLVSKLGSTTGMETISVNKDNYFNAPIETDQCRSNSGVTPSSACAGAPPTATRATAKTSPYEYLTTAMFPACALGGADDSCGSVSIPAAPNEVCDGNRRCTKVDGRGGQWSKDCAGPFCYGVPIYRQFLTGTTLPEQPGEWAGWQANCKTPAQKASPACRFPFARMAGAKGFQRSVMTVNNGTYYVDTTVSQKTQATSQFAGLASVVYDGYVDCSVKTSGPNCAPLSVNAFQPNQKYHMFFLFARKSTKQVYQFYVGDTAAVPTSIVAAQRVNIDGFPVKPTAAAWPSTWKREMIAGPDGKMNVLQVTVDFSGFTDIDPAASPTVTGLCKPADFCKVNGSSCGCALPKPVSGVVSSDSRLAANASLWNTCDQACRTWAVKDVDCPPKGCYGFVLTMPAKFVADDTYHRPDPTQYPAWQRRFDNTAVAPDNAGGDCYYNDVPGNAKRLKSTETCVVPQATPAAPQPPL